MTLESKNKQLIKESLQKAKYNRITKDQSRLEIEAILGHTVSDEKFDKLFNQYIGNNDTYDSDIQKMISYKGIIRPITLKLKNKYGGEYKMRIINIYVKPNIPKMEIVRDSNKKPIYDGHGKVQRKPVYETVIIDGKPIQKEVIKENTRNYEEKVYSVDKQAIKHGNSSDYYYPDKALWSKERLNTVNTEGLGSLNRKEKVKTEFTELRKKAKLRALKRKKPQNKTKCRCIRRKQGYVYPYQRVKKWGIPLIKHLKSKEMGVYLSYKPPQNDIFPSILLLGKTPNIYLLYTPSK